GGDDVITSGGASLVANPFTFTGRRQDAETGLFYDRARYYDTTLGRFLSRDPLGAPDGSSLYQYVGDNPTDGTDPYGLFLVVKDLGFQDRSARCGPLGLCGRYAWSNNFDLYNVGVFRTIPSGQVRIPFLGLVQWGVWLQRVSAAWGCVSCTMPP